MEVIVTRGFQKDLRKVPSYIQNKVGEVIAILEKSDSLEKSGVEYKKMSGQQKDEKYFRIRIANYRMGIEQRKPKVIIICIMERSQIYKSFPPK